MNSFRLAPAAFGLAFCLFANSAFAQYVWIDDKGGKQFSDLPPPAHIPKDRIIKQPGGAYKIPTPAPAPSAAKSGEEQKGPKSIAEQNAEFRKRRAEQAEKEKKAEEEATYQTERKKNCDRARAYQRTLESGVRIAQTDASGERSFMTDEERAKELKETQRAVADCK